MTASKILFYLCISFVVGIFLGSALRIPQFVLWIFLFSAVLIIFLFILSFPRKRESIGLCRWIPLFRGMTGVAGFCVLFLVLGIVRLQISEFNIQNDKLSKLNDTGEVVLTGIISSEPDVRDTFQKLKVNVSDSMVLVTTQRYPEYKYLDEIKLTGKLETPSVTDEFNYKNYLMKDHIYSVMAFPKIELVSDKHKYSAFSYLYEKILFFKQELRQSIRQNFLPPQSLILEGTILGDNGAMTVDLKNKLNITGLRHVIAVSGTHVVILSTILMSLLIALGLWRSQAFYVAIIFICLYIVLTGLPASGIRAGIMGGLYLLAQKLGRQSMGLRVIASACAVMLLINPLLLFYDVGFQLSFLAVLGLILIEPLVRRFLKFIFEKISKIKVSDKSESIFQMISTTFAAQIFTLPVIIYNFGNISFVAPVTNILILPIVSLLMIFGFLTSFIGIFSDVLGFLISIPCWLLLTYFVKVIDFFSQPWAMKTFQNVSWIWLVILYLLLGFCVRFLNKKFVYKF